MLENQCDRRLRRGDRLPRSRLEAFISLGLVMCFPDFSVIYYVDRRTRAGPLRDEVSRAAFT
jgi:hypothetical protein